MSKPSGIALALRKSGAAVAAVPQAPAPEPAPPPAAIAAVPAPAPTTRSRAAKPPAPSRKGTEPFTVHFPPEVRRQVKVMAAEQGRGMDDIVAEALNLVFVKYRKPEVAPRKSGNPA